MDQPLEELVSALAGKSVIVLGDVILDEYVWGDVRRISPEAPVPVVEVTSRTCLPGGAANVAVNVAALGSEARVVGVVGQDDNAARLADVLRRQGVEPDGLVEEEGRVTSCKTRVIAHSQQVVRLDREVCTPVNPVTEEALIRWFQDRLEWADACVLSDYAKGVVTPRLAQRFIRAAAQGGKPVIVDPKGPDLSAYRGATVLKPNLREAERYAGREADDEAGVRDVGRCLAASLVGTTVVITRGSRGISLFRQGSEPVWIPAVARHVYDVTGAGDTVAAVLAVAMAAGLTLEQGVRLATLAAGIVVGKVGTATVTQDELHQAVQGWTG